MLIVALIDSLASLFNALTDDFFGNTSYEIGDSFLRIVYFSFT